MRAAIKDVGTAVGEAVGPAFVSLAQVVTGAARAMAKFVRDNQQLVRTIAAVGGSLMAWGAAMTFVGSGMSMFSRGITYLIGPIGQLAAGLKAALVILGAFATSGPVVTAVAVLAAIGAGAAAGGADLRKLAGDIGGAFANPVKNFKAVFGDLLATTNLTIEGIYRAIAAGDLGGAVDVLWAGFQAAWARGEQAVMGSLDPWIEGVQNVFSDLGIGMVAMWDQAWTDLATSDWGGYVLGALDNFVNTVLATWDFLIGNIQKGWAMMWNAIGRTSDEEMAKEIARVDAANAGNAAERDRIRPGFAGRTNLSDEQKARMQKESLDRQNAMFDEADRLRRERADRTRQNVVDRQAAVAAANKNLQDQVNRFPALKPVQKIADVKQSVTGTFSSFGLGQMGAFNVAREQLEELKRIRGAINNQAVMVGQ